MTEEELQPGVVLIDENGCRHKVIGRRAGNLWTLSKRNKMNTTGHLWTLAEINERKNKAAPPLLKLNL